jgi:hypothetical protein
MSERSILKVLKISTIYLLTGCFLTGCVMSACASSEYSTDSDYYSNETETSDYTETGTLGNIETIDPNTSETTDIPTWSPKSPSTKELPNLDFPKSPSTKELPNFDFPKSPSTKDLPKLDFPKSPSTKELPNLDFPKSPSTKELPNFDFPKSPSTKDLPKLDFPKSPSTKDLPKLDFPKSPSTKELPNFDFPKSPIDKPIYPQTKEPTDNGEFSASVQLYGEKTDVTLGEDILLKLSAVNLITKPTMHVQVILLPPSGMSVTSSEFVLSGAGQYTTTYELEPGQGKDIEVRIKSNQVGNFDVTGKVIYYFVDDPENAEYYTLNLPIKVNEGALSGSQSTPTEISGFGSFIALIGLLSFYALKRRDL